MGEKKRFLDRVLRFMGIEEEVAASEEFEERDSQSPASGVTYAPRPDVDPKERTTSRTTSIRLFTREPAVHIKPLRFNDVQSIADRLVDRTPVLVDIEQLDARTARRVLDFLGGTTYALAGHIQEVSAHKFLLAPGGVEVDMDSLGVPPGDELDEEFTFRKE